MGIRQIGAMCPRDCVWTCRRSVGSCDFLFTTPYGVGNPTPRLIASKETK